MTQQHPIGTKGRIGIWILPESSRTNDMFQGTTSLDTKEGISMTEPFTIQFNDLDTLQEALVIVRYDDRCVVVALSHKEDGDLQVVMNKDDARRLLEALNAAVN